MGDYLIRRLTNQDSDFYPILGPFLGSRQVAKELSIPAWDDPGKVWYVATLNGTVCGFVAATRTARSVTFCSDYVAPEHRGAGVYAELSAARMHDHMGEPLITAVVAHGALGTYAKHGFTPTGKRGRFTAVKREVKHG